MVETNYDKLIADMNATAKTRKKWEEVKKAASKVIDVSVFNLGLGPAFEQYRMNAKGGFELMKMHRKLDDKPLRQIAAKKAAFDKIMTAYLKLAATRQNNPTDKLTKPKGTVDPGVQKSAWAKIDRALREIKHETDRWWRDLEHTAEEQRKIMQGEYRR